jgi:hypothetical protein
MGESYELVRKNVEEVVDVRNNWFNNKEEAEEFYFQMKRIPDKEDFNRACEHVCKATVDQTRALRCGFI